MSFNRPSESLVRKMRDYVESLVQSGKPRLVKYIARGDNRRLAQRPFEGEDRRKTIALNHLAAQVAGPDLDAPDDVA